MSVTAYNVIAARHGVNVPVGVVFFKKTHQGEGWIFSPYYQAGRSRKLWPTPQAAMKGRVSAYTLEPKVTP